MSSQSGASPEAEEVAGPWRNAGTDCLAGGTEDVDVAGEQFEEELGARQGRSCLAQTQKYEKHEKMERQGAGPAQAPGPQSRGD